MAVQYDPLININSIMSTTSQLPIIHVSTDPERWCDRFHHLNLAIHKTQVKSRNDIIYTGFHMQLRS